MPSITGPSEYVLEPFREGTDVTLYRGRQHRSALPVLVVALARHEGRTILVLTDPGGEPLDLVLESSFVGLFLYGEERLGPKLLLVNLRNVATVEASTVYSGRRCKRWLGIRESIYLSSGVGLSEMSD
jgi:hypothetical protein